MIPARVLSNKAIDFAIQQAEIRNVWVDVSSSSEANSPYLKGNKVFRTQYPSKRPFLDITNPEHLEHETFLDIDNCHLTANCVDLLTCGQVIEHMLFPVRAFREAERIVRPGGIVAFTTVFSFDVHGEIDYYRFTTLALKHLAQHVGLAVLKTFSEGPSKRPGGVGVVCQVVDRTPGLKPLGG